MLSVFGLQAFLPCFWVYMDVGKYLLAKRKELAGDGEAQLNPIYSKWIGALSCP